MSAARLRRPALVALALSAAACDGDPPLVACPATFAPTAAVVVEPFDSVSGARVEGAGGWAITGNRADSLAGYAWTVEGRTLALAAYGSPGTYALVVRRDGYLDWAVSGVRVRPGECGVRTEVIRARMQPAPVLGPHDGQRHR